MAWTRLQSIADAAGVDAAWLKAWLRDEIQRRRDAAGRTRDAAPVDLDKRRCRSCGSEIEQRSGRGRPRKFCTACIPVGSAATVAKSWRRVMRHTSSNPDSRVP